MYRAPRIVRDLLQCFRKGMHDSVLPEHRVASDPTARRILVMRPGNQQADRERFLKASPEQHRAWLEEMTKAAEQAKVEAEESLHREQVWQRNQMRTIRRTRG